MDGGLQLGTPLSPHTVARLVLYLQELVRWNAKVNLTGLAAERDIISKHFLDSLAAAKIITPDPGLIRPGPGRRVLDVGTGAGFPGLVLKLQEPDLAVTLLEPSQKKAAFLHHMIGLLGLSGVTVLIQRLEQLAGPDHEGYYDLVTTRAVRPELILAQAPRLLAPGGHILLFRAAPMETVPSGFSLIRQVSFTLPFTNDPRTLTLLAPTPQS
jgi:16S rRNA (guanine527-N7)-methyltransferase